MLNNVEDGTYQVIVLFIIKSVDESTLVDVRHQFILLSFA